VSVVKLGMTYILKGTLTAATEFAMAHYVSYELVDPGSPPSDASDLSQDTVEDLNLYKDQVC
jgi:hypothetical protein